MKRILIALLVGGAVFAAVFGAASSLSISPAYVQAGVTTDLECDMDHSIRVDGWGFELDDLLVDYVRFGGIDDACEGACFMAAVYDSGGSQLDGNLYGKLTGLSGDDNKVKLYFSTPVPASLIEELHVGMHWKATCP